MAGMYFVTICTYKRATIFGRCKNDIVILNRFGQIARDELLKSALIRPAIEIDQYVIMPNHVHAIIIVNVAGESSKATVSEQVDDGVGATRRVARMWASHSLLFIRIR